MNYGVGNRFFSLLMSFAICISLATVAGGRGSEFFRFIEIRGQRVHWRRVIPRALTHKDVIRHFRPGEVLITDRLRLGIAHTGYGTGVWYHVRPLTSDEWGWVSGAYIAETPDELTLDELERKEVAEAAAPPTTPAAAPAQPAHQRSLHDYIQIAANIGTIIVAIITVGGSRLFARLMAKLFFTAIPQPVMSAAGARPYVPNFNYFNNGVVIDSMKKA